MPGGRRGGSGEVWRRTTKGIKWARTALSGESRVAFPAHLQDSGAESLGGALIQLNLLLTRIVSVSPQIAFLLRRGGRSFASQTEGEIRMTRVLQEKFPQAVAIKVVDISGEERRFSLGPH